MDFLGISDFGLFLAAVLLLNATPGPDTAYIVGRSVAQGWRAGLLSALGISAGCCMHAMASALGLSTILASSATAFTLIKLAGGAYLAYLGLRMMLARPAKSDAPATVPDVRATHTIFLQALVTNVLNPKVILFFLAFIPQFVRADASRKTPAFLALGAVFAFISLFWNSGTALLAARLVRSAGRSPGVRRWQERIVGAGFLTLGARLALSHT